MSLIILIVYTGNAEVRQQEGGKRVTTEEKLVELTAKIEGINPFDLQKKLKKGLREFQAYNSRSADAAGKYAM